MALQQMCNDLLHSLHDVFWFTYSALTWPIRKLKTSIIFVVDYMFNKTVSTVQKLLLTWSIFVVLLVVSLMVYAMFYSSFVPTAEISRPVYLKFRVCPSGVGICSFPSANVTFWNDEGTVQEFLGPGQVYSVEFTLVMPDSHANRDLGMFMVVIQMYDREGQVSAISQRSTMHRYRSIFMQVMEVIVLSPLYFVGFLEQKKTLTVELFSHFVDDYYHPSIGANVEIHNHKIEIYSATLKLTAKFTGLKYFLHNWPLVSAFCAFWFNLFILATGVAAVLLQRESQRRRNERQVEDRVTEEDVEDIHETSLHQTFDHKNTQDSSTQTELHDDDENPKTTDLPLVQEPADFPIPQESEDIWTELRQRRVN